MDKRHNLITTSISPRRAVTVNQPMFLCENRVHVVSNLQRRRLHFVVRGLYVFYNRRITFERAYSNAQWYPPLDAYYMCVRTAYRWETTARDYKELYFIYLFFYVFNSYMNLFLVLQYK